MVMTLLAPADGCVLFQKLEGSLLSPGDLIAQLELDNPDAAQQVTPYCGGFPELGPPLVQSFKVDQKFKTTLADCKNVLQGMPCWSFQKLAFGSILLLSTRSKSKCERCVW